MHSLASLQTLRAAAAWMVVTHHYMQIVHGFGTSVAFLLLLPLLWPAEWLGSAVASSSLIRLFAFGMLLSSLFVRRQGRLAHGADPSSRWWLALVVLACFVALLGRPLPLLWRVEGFVMQALACGLVWTVVINENWFQRWPAARFWKYLGDASYSTYLLHPSAMFCLLGLSVTQSTWAKQESFFVACVVLTGLVSHLSYRVIESGQLTRRLQRWCLVKLKR